MMDKYVAAAAAASACLLQGAFAQPAEPTIEPDYFYPWAVEMSVCHGVLIAPNWVLTAAHCIDSVGGPTSITLKRRDVYSGAEFVKTIVFAQTGGATPGVFTHPGWVKAAFADGPNDIGLVKLVRPLQFDTYAQAAALPATKRQSGVVGALATRHGADNLEPGEATIYRAPISPDVLEDRFKIANADATTALVEGDSGSGFVAIEGGRAVVRGVAAHVGALSATFTDVFHHRDWIIETMGEDAAYLDGDTRLRRTGPAARGFINILCGDKNGSHTAPLDIPGAEIRTKCEPGTKQAVVCVITHDMAGATIARERTIRRLRVSTITRRGVSREDVAPAHPRVAAYHKTLPDGARRIIDCVTQSPALGGVEPPVATEF